MYRWAKQLWFNDFNTYQHLAPNALPEAKARVSVK
jgi:hypothetical protein